MTEKGGQQPGRAVCVRGSGDDAGRWTSLYAGVESTQWVRGAGLRMFLGRWCRQVPGDWSDKISSGLGLAYRIP